MFPAPICRRPTFTFAPRVFRSAHHKPTCMVSAELSLYPLTPDYAPVIVDFIRTLRAQPGVEVATNGLSTQLTGEYPAVMAALTRAMEPTLAGAVTCSFVIKLLNVAVEPGAEVEV